MGEAVGEIGQDSCNCGIFVVENCLVPKAGFGGSILNPIIGTLNKAAETARGRMGGIGVDLMRTSGELRRAAWAYSAQDYENYSALNAAKSPT
ncbi:hypothetical protein [Nocardia transvalensis]|uniref:hypothetical protein n=1 Tax=Nocardia transvalensis TaxID=37333 RepID=UPI001893FB02|nr:hypothetical protein [Nocardia transvalensis]MBF6333262.1 hypothetical protein [Nocardia transvalensis]